MLMDVSHAKRMLTFPLRPRPASRSAGLRTTDWVGKARRSQPPVHTREQEGEIFSLSGLPCLLRRNVPQSTFNTKLIRARISLKFNRSWPPGKWSSRILSFLLLQLSCRLPWGGWQQDCSSWNYWFFFSRRKRLGEKLPARSFRVMWTVRVPLFLLSLVS